MLVGAGTLTGHDLALALAARGATVVITDRTADALLRTARHAPESIQTLECDLRRPDICARIGAIWGAEPLSGVVNLLPLAQPGLMEMALRSSVGLGRGFRGALMAGRGCLTLCAPLAEPEHWAGLAAEAAMEHLVKEMAQGLAPGRIRVNGILAEASVTGAAMAAVLAMLGQQRGINGAMIPLAGRPVALEAGGERQARSD